MITFCSQCTAPKSCDPERGIDTAGTDHRDAIQITTFLPYPVIIKASCPVVEPGGKYIKSDPGPEIGCPGGSGKRPITCDRGSVESFVQSGFRGNSLCATWRSEVFAFAQERGNLSYQVCASWLDRLEQEEHELTTDNELIVLADIYNFPIEQLLRSYIQDAQPMSLRQLSRPNETMLLTEGPLEAQAKYLPDTLGFDRPLDEPTLLAAEKGFSLANYRRDVIGKRDRTLDPMIPPGLTVYVDTNKRAIPHTKKPGR